ncbi:hypothetical protein A3C17_02915 [Candidatus Uhrbacteria bacterium RIFCSPHIGHO2_02_FULL_53_13]|uniref:Adenylate kinase n=2 Tax=Candidatus Uhriibacteriota TaxID=1752732 RepID=A0A1F7U1U6_9BACT|nr:MAG: hypothetical protein A3C17_02915 [Candidatus Uhrbacteria bacterium RIFCSPHIGHO2_02_FULL_53_13]OGL89087.1 MAG: hypothetical protein A3I45_02310 [Candidatus Uhrbacteria bacterium RIFCSPLOWO2_02_FULL_53_10]
MIVIILGPQGSGKGTQGKKLAEFFGVPFVSAGELLREEAALGSELGRRIHEIINVQGELVPPEVITDLLDARRMKDDAKQGMIIDSYPRDLQQLELMRKRFTPDVVVVLNLSDDEAIKRLGGRRQCPDGHIYHLVFNPPKREGVCDVDGKQLLVRDDDREEAIRNRLGWHRGKTEPMIGAMEQSGVRVVHVDASAGIDDVQNAVRKIVGI